MEQVHAYLEWVNWATSNAWLFGLGFFALLTAWVLFVELRIQKAFWPGDDA